MWIEQVNEMILQIMLLSLGGIRKEINCYHRHTHSLIDTLGNTTIQFLHTEDDADRHIWAYITTLLGCLQCRTDVQLADGKALFLKYISSYVIKMHESATSEGLYCTDVTGYQATNSFLCTVKPIN